MRRNDLAWSDRTAQNRGAGRAYGRRPGPERAWQRNAATEGRATCRRCDFSEGVSTANQELLVEVKKLISIGKEKGFLTYDELNSTLPAEVVSSEQFGSIMSMFGEMDIEIVDAPEGERQQKSRTTGEKDEGGEEADEGEGAEENEKEIDLKQGALS